MDGNIEITKSNTYFYVDSSSNDMILYTGTSNQHILIGTVSNDTSILNICKSNVTFNRTVAFSSNVTIGSNPLYGTQNFATLQTTNDFAILANDSSWTSNHGGKALYMRYSTYSNEDSAYIQSIYRDGTSSNFENLNIQASNIYLSTGGLTPNPNLTIRTDGKVGIGTSNPTELLQVMGNIKTTGNVILNSNNPILFASNSAIGYAARMGVNLFNSSNYLDIVGGAAAGDTGRKIFFWINSNQIAGVPGEAIFHGGDVIIDNGKLLIGTSNQMDGVANIAGKVYIGVSNASNISDSVLHISKSNDCVMSFEYVGNQMGQIRLTSNAMKIGIDGAGDFSFVSGMSMVDGTGGVEIMHITQSNIYISSNLTIGGTINASNLQLSGASLSTSVGGGFSAASNNISYTMCNIGIGISNPTNALEVSGTVLFTNVFSNLGTMNVASNMTVNSLIVKQNINTSNTLSNFGNAYFASNVVVNSNLYVNQQLITSNVIVNQSIISSNTFSNLGNAFIGCNLVVASNLTVSYQVLFSNTFSNLGNAFIGCNLLIGSNLNVNYQALFSNTFSNLGNAYIGSNLLINSNLYVKQQIIGSNTFSNLGNASFASNVFVGSNLNVNQQVLFSNTFSNLGNASFSSNVVIGSNLNTYQLFNSNTFSNLGNAYFDNDVTFNSNLYVNTIQVLPKVDNSYFMSSNLGSNLRVNLQTKAINSARVSAWDIFTQYSAAQQPYWFNNTGINGRSAVSFYTPSNTMMWASNVTFNTSTTGGFTFAMYCKFTSNTFWERIIEATPNSNPVFEQFVVSRVGSSCNLNISIAGNASGIGNIPIVNNTYSIIIYRYAFSNNNHKVWQSNVLVYNSNTSVSIGSGGWNIGLGANIYGSNNFTTGLSPNQNQFGGFDLQALFMYDRALTDVEIDLLYNYLNANSASSMITYAGVYGGNFITSDGYVGIGTSVPSYKLHITDSNSNVAIRMTASNSLISDIGVVGISNDFITGSKKGDLCILNTIGSNILFGSTSNSNVITVTQSNIGIFNSNPAYTLDVTGSTNITSTLNVGGVVTVASNIMPLSNLVYDLGSSNMRFRTLYVASNTIDMQGVQIKIDSATGGLKLTDSNNSNVPLIVDKLILGSGSNVVHMTTDSNNNVTFKNVTLSNGIEVSSSNTSVGGWSNNSSNIFILNSNVGIGLSNPTKTLDVQGDINFTGTLYQAGVPFVSGGGGGGGGSTSKLTIDSNNTLTLSTSNTWSILSPVMIYAPSRTISLTGTSNNVNGLILDTSNFIYVTGKYSSNTTITSTTSNNTTVINVPANGSTSVYVVKYSSNGVPSWMSTIDGVGNDLSTGITSDTSNNVFVVGSFNTSNSIVYNATSNINTIVASLPTPCNTSAYIVKYDQYGIARWANALDSIGIDSINSVCTDTSNNIIVVGTITGSNPNVYDQGITYNNTVYSMDPYLFVRTIVGTGTSGYVDATGTDAQFANPRGTAIDSLGNIYVADYDNNRIRKISPNRVVTTFAGSGTATYLDGIGTNASFKNPYGIICDLSNNIYVADQGNQRIRKITPTGVVTTIAGSGTQTFLDGTGTNAGFYNPSGLALDSNWNLYVGDWVNNRIRKITPSGVVTTFAGSGTSTFLDGTGTNAGFNTPRLICCDTSNIYVADTGNNRIRTINLSTSVVSTLAGSGTMTFLDGLGTVAGFNAPRGITVDYIGNVYVSDSGNARVRKITPDGNVTTIAGSGTSTFIDGIGTNAGFGTGIISITADLYGNLIVTDNVFHSIRRIELNSINVTTYAGTGTATYVNGYGAYAGFNGLYGITRDSSGNIYTTETSIPVVRKITPDGNVSTFAGSGTFTFLDGIGTNAGFSNPRGMAIDPDGNLVVVDTLNNRIRKITPDGIVTTIAGSNSGSSTDGIGTNARFQNPRSVAIDQSGNMYITDQTNRKIRKIDKYGLVTTLAGNGQSGTIDAPGTYAWFYLYGLYGIGIDSTGSNIYIPEYTSHKIRKLTLGTNTLLVAGSGTVTFIDGTGSNSGFHRPSDIVMDTNSNLYVTDRLNRRIRKITSTGIVSTIAGSGTSTYLDGLGTNAGFTNPWGITIDSNNTLYVLDRDVQCIRKITQDGTVSTLTNVSGTTGAGIPLYLASFMTIDNANNLYAVDYGNNCIQKIDPSGKISQYIGSGQASYSNGIGTLANFNAPWGIALDNSYNNMYLSARYNYKISKVIPTSIVTTVAGNSSSKSINSVGIYASFSNPSGIVNDIDGNIYVSDLTGIISKISKYGGVSLYAGGNTLVTSDGLGTNAGFSNPQFMNLDSSNNIYIADTNNHKIRKIIPSYYVNTLAGSGTGTFLEGTGTNAGFNNPRGIAVDYCTGNIFVTDLTNYRIRKISPRQVVSTYIGSGTSSYAEGTGTLASIKDCYGIISDSFGNLYITDTGNNRIRVIIPTGVSSTTAGSGTATYLDGLGTNAGFNLPHNVVVDSVGNIFLSDSSNNRIRKIDTSGNVSTFAGSGTATYVNGTGTAAGFRNPQGLAIDNDDNIYVADTGNHRIRKITSAGVVTVVAGTGSAGSNNHPNVLTFAAFNAPSGVTVDYTGNIYVADTSNNLIRKIVPNTGAVFIVAGKYTATYADGNYIDAGFNKPMGIIIDSSNNLFVADTNNNCIRKITPDATVTTFAGSSTATFADGIGTNAGFNQPIGLSVDFNNNLYITDSGNNRIRKVTYTGNVSTLAGSGTGTYLDSTGSNIGFSNPSGIYLSSGIFYIADKNNNRIRTMDLVGTTSNLAGSGTATFVDGIGTNAGFNSPVAITIDNSNNLYIGDNGNYRVRKITSTGVVTTIAGKGTATYVDGLGTNAGFVDIWGITVSYTNKIGGIDYINRLDYPVLYVSDRSTYNRVRRITPDGNVTTFAGSGTTYLDGTGTNAGFISPYGIVSDLSGNLYVCDIVAHRIRKITSSGVVSTLAGTGTTTFLDDIGTLASFNFPAGLCLDLYGNILVTDITNNRIRRIQSVGNVVTFAGSGTGTYLNGQGLNASFYFPHGVCWETNTESFYVTDQGNHRIRRIGETSIVSTLAGAGTTGFFDGTGTNAIFYNPAGITIDKDGVFYIADRNNNRVRKMVLNLNNVTTFAGSGTATYLDGLGTNAGFNNPSGLLTDSSGNVYVAEYNSHVIRKITSDGNVTTFVGSGTGTFADGIGTNASFNNPRGITIDSLGNFYVTDTNNNRIRKITHNGIVTTFAGSGTATYVDGVGTNAGFNGPYTLTCDSYDNIYVAELSHKIRKITPNGIVTTFAGNGTASYLDGIGTNARFSTQFVGISIDSSNNLYVTDHGNLRLRKISPNGTVTTLAGSGTATYLDGTGTNAGFTSLRDCSVDKSTGIIYIAEIVSKIIRKVTPDGIVSTLAGSGDASSTDGIGTNASFNNPISVVYDVSSGNIYVGGGNVIRKISISSEITTIAGSGTQTFLDGTGTNAGFSFPNKLVCDSLNNIYVADEANNRIRKITPAGVVTTLAGSGTGTFADGTGTNASLYSPAGLCVDQNDNLYVADRGTNRIRKITPSGVVTTFAGSGALTFINGIGTNAGFRSPRGITIDSDGNLYVADTGNHLIRKITPDGTVTTFAGLGAATMVDGLNTTACFNNPYGITIDSKNNLYVVDLSNQRVRKIRPNGFVTTIAGSGSAAYADGIGLGNAFYSPNDVVCDLYDNLYIADYGNQRIRKLSLSLPNYVSVYAGSGTASSGGGIGTASGFQSPTGISSDIAGNLFIADLNNHRIRKISPGAVVSTFAGSAASGYRDGPGVTALFSGPKSITVNQNDGTMYVIDLTNKIRNITPAGNVSSITRGTTSISYNNDDIGMNANFKSLKSISIDSQNNIYVVDSGTGCNRIRKIVPTGYLVNIAGTGSNNSIDGYHMNASVSDLNGLSINPTTGDLLILDQNNHKIRKLVPSAIVSKYIGTGTGTTIDGIGYNVAVNEPYGIISDNDGNIWFTEFSGHCIRKITSNRVVTTIAGSPGISGSSDGVGTNARFNNPRGITIDSDGNLYVADTGNNKIKKITQNGIVTTFAGSGTATYLDGVGTNAAFYNPWDISVDSSNNFYIADYFNAKIRKITSTGIVTTISGNIISSDHPDGIGTQAAFQVPTGITVDKNGNIYVTDYNAHKIRKIDSNLKVTTLAGKGGGTGIYVDCIGTFAAFTNPIGIVVDNTGENLYITSEGTRIRQLNIQSGLVSTIAGSGSAGSIDGIGASAVFNGLRGICIDKTGKIYVAESTGRFIRTVEYNAITTVAGSGTGTYFEGLGLYAGYSNPTAAIQDSQGTAYIVDQGNSRIRRMETNMVSTWAGSGTASYLDGVGTLARFNQPVDATVDIYGNVYITESNLRIRKIDQKQIVTTIAGNGTSTIVEGIGSNASFLSANALISDPTGNLYVCNNTVITKIEPLDPVETIVSSLNNPTGVVSDSTSNIFVVNKDSHTISKITWSGTITTFAGSGTGTFLDGTGTNAGFNYPSKISVDYYDNLYVTDTSNNRIRKITQSGVVTTIAGSGTATYLDGTGTNAGFNSPVGITIDQTGIIYVSDNANHMIRKISSTGVVTTFAGSGTGTFVNGQGTNAGFSNPMGLSLTSNGILYVADYGNHLIRKITSDATVTTYAGSGTATFFDAIGTSAGFNLPRDVIADTNNVYVADYGNNRIRKIYSGGIVRTIAGSGTATFVDELGFYAGIASPTGINMDNIGNLYVTADSRLRKIVNVAYQTTSNILVRSSNTSIPASTDSNDQYAFAVKYNSSGNSQWSVSINGTSSDNASSVVSDSSNNIFIIGTYASNAVIYRNQLATSFGLSNPLGSNSIFGVKLGSNGYPLWITRIDGLGDEIANGCCVDTNNNLYITGYYEGSSANIYNSNGTIFASTLPSTTYKSAFIVSYGSNGSTNWCTTISGSNEVISNSIITDASNNVYITGTYKGTISPVINNSSNIASTLTLPVPTGNQGSNTATFIVKYDSNGIPQNALGMIGVSNTTVNAIDIDQSGSNIYIGGSYSGSTSLYDASGNLTSMTLSNSAVPSSYINNYSFQSSQFTLLSSLGTASNGLQKYITNTGSVPITLNITSSNGSTVLNSYTIESTSNMIFTWFGNSWYKFV